MHEILSSAPASLMVCGEHAVVQGYAALVLAVAARLTVRLKARSDHHIIIQSALGNYAGELGNLPPAPHLAFVVESIREMSPRTGFELNIESAINPNMGLGSSAASVVATVGALWALERRQSALSHADLRQLHQKAHAVILRVQKRGSGADLAAALCGGWVGYEPARGNDFYALPLPPTMVSVRYAGYKTKTADVLAMLAERASHEPKRFVDLYAQMGAVSAQALEAAKREDWAVFYACLNDYQALMADLGVCDAVQAAHIAEAKALSQAVKISGSGLGDCIIALGEYLPAAHEVVYPSEAGLLISF